MSTTSGSRPPSPALLVAGCVLALMALAVTAGCAGTPRTREATDVSGEVSRTPYPSVPDEQRSDKTGLKLVFEDEFDGEEIDPKRWTTRLAWGRTNGEEMQYYADESVEVSGGVLEITARRQETGGKPFTSGVISSHGKYAFRYGYLEVRARTVRGQGLWPAFWTLSTVPKDPNEIDIVECIGSNPYRNEMSLHWGFGSSKRQSMTYTGPDLSADFHTYAIDWQPDSITWYIDDIERFVVREHVPAAPMYVIANLAVGGVYPGEPDTTTPAAATYAIDAIRVYQGARHQANGQGAPSGAQ